MSYGVRLTPRTRWGTLRWMFGRGVRGDLYYSLEQLENMDTQHWLHAKRVEKLAQRANQLRMLEWKMVGPLKEHVRARYQRAYKQLKQNVQHYASVTRRDARRRGWKLDKDFRMYRHDLNNFQIKAYKALDAIGYQGTIAQFASSATYYTSQYARMFWYYAQQSGIDKKLDPSGDTSMMLGTAVTALGIISTGTFAVASIAQGNVLAGGLALASMPIQLQRISEGWKHHNKNKRLKRYYDNELDNIIGQLNLIASGAG